MPFKSEAQRKYLWANEPAIARDWTDTYGSRIQKDDGGLTQLVQPGLGRPGYAGPHDNTGGTDYGKSQGMSPGAAQARGLGAQHHGSTSSGNLHAGNVGEGGGQGYVPGIGIVKAPTPKGEGIIQGIKNFPQNMRTYGLKKNIDHYFNKKKLGPALFELMKGPQEEEDYYTEFSGLSPLEMKAKYTGTLSDEDIARVQHMSGVLGQDKITQSDFEDAFYGPKGPPDLSGGGDGPQAEWQRLGYPSLAAYQAAMGGGASVDDTTTTTTASTSDLGSGHFKVPDEYILAEGGRAGYQMGNMVGAEMEGAEMEGAVMQSKEVIKELYDAFIAQGLSPQEAIEKIKEIIASSQAQEPESPMMAEEFPGQEFGGGPRASAAFGGIMDTYTGRRKYGLGSFIKKAFKKVKKLASSKLGKMALMYAAGTYLGGTQAFGGTGWGSGAGATPWKKFGAQLLSPTGGQGIGNIFNPTGGLGKGKGWSMFQKATPIVQASTKYGAADVIDKANRLGVNPVKSDWSKWILPASIGAGAYTALAPVDDLDDTQGEWDKKKEEFDAYLASLDTGDSYRVPQEYIKSAEGGRIGRQEGGLMDLGGMEKDYRNDGGFVPLGGEEKADDVPARLSRNEFVFTADAVKNAGGGDIDKGAEVMENVMKNLEAGGKVSEESQGQGAQDMFEVSERLSEVV
jgi:hypothetical protein